MTFKYSMKSDAYAWFFVSACCCSLLGGMNRASIKMVRILGSIAVYQVCFVKLFDKTFSKV